MINTVSREDFALWLKKMNGGNGEVIASEIQDHENSVARAKAGLIYFSLLTRLGRDIPSIDVEYHECEVKRQQLNLEKLYKSFEDNLNAEIKDDGILAQLESRKLLDKIEMVNGRLVLTTKMIKEGKIKKGRFTISFLGTNISHIKFKNLDYSCTGYELPHISANACWGTFGPELEILWKEKSWLYIIDLILMYLQTGTEGDEGYITKAQYYAKRIDLNKHAKQTRVLKLGDTVKLLPSTIFNDADSNPIWGGSEGKILGVVTLLDEDGDIEVSVDWENGTNNSGYVLGRDLAIVRTKK